MKHLMMLGCAGLVLSASAQDLARPYASFGELLVTQMVAAPFPHPQRAEGRKYKEKFFSAREHYSDRTVAVFIPKGFQETGRVDFVVHFHGWGNHVESVLKQYKLIEQLAESGRNAVLVVPQGPRDASDSFGGKLEDPDGFKRFMEEVVLVLRGQSGLKRKDFALGNIILSGHSGGYQVMASIVDHGGLTEHVREVWLFDALYARTEQFLAWSDRNHGRLLNIYTDHGGTKEETEQVMATLKQRGTGYLAGEEAELKPVQLQVCQPVFLHTALGHNEVLEKHRTFEEFLKTSCLGARERQQ